MNISGIRPSEGFYSYNEIKLNELRNQQIAAAQQAHAASEEPEVQEVVAESVMPQQTFTSYDYAQTYNPNDSFALRGGDSDINQLDLERALSVLDRDQVLQQYRYFVGTELSPTVKEIPQEAQPDITLRSGENFML